MTLTARLDSRWGRAYFGAQAAAGALWWAAVALSPGIRMLTLGDLPAGLVAAVDIPLFVIASALAALGVRFAAEITASWTVLITATMALYSTVTALAGWGSLLMIAASVCSVGSVLLVRLNRIPSEWLLIGPFRAREATSARPGTQLLRTAGQIVVFWGVCLVVVPAGSRSSSSGGGCGCRSRPPSRSPASSSSQPPRRSGSGRRSRWRGAVTAPRCRSRQPGCSWWAARIGSCAIRWPWRGSPRGWLSA